MSYICHSTHCQSWLLPQPNIKQVIEPWPCIGQDAQGFIVPHDECPWSSCHSCCCQIWHIHPQIRHIFSLSCLIWGRPLRWKNIVLPGIVTFAMIGLMAPFQVLYGTYPLNNVQVNAHLRITTLAGFPLSCKIWGWPLRWKNIVLSGFVTFAMVVWTVFLDPLYCAHPLNNVRVNALSWTTTDILHRNCHYSMNFQFW